VFRARLRLGCFLLCVGGGLRCLPGLGMHRRCGGKIHSRPCGALFHDDRWWCGRWDRRGGRLRHGAARFGRKEALRQLIQPFVHAPDEAVDVILLPAERLQFETVFVFHVRELAGTRTIQLIVKNNPIIDSLNVNPPCPH